ncbi:MAG: phytoene/squalene synthase family protein [Culicoidibacterales bacterium]
MSILDDFQYCKNIIKANSASFYKAFSQLPEHKARAIFVVYAFCRMADDAIDVHKNVALLEQIKEHLDHFSQGSYIDLPLWRALRVVFTEFEMDITPFYQLLEGQVLDISFTQPRTIEQLASYSYFVAGTVGLMILPIIATVNQQKLQQAAVDLGYAMQLTNILRDVGEDLNLGRIYLPQELMTKFDVQLAELKSCVVTPKFIKLWEHLAQIADAHYQNFAKNYHLFDADSLFSVKLSSLFYHEILTVIRNHNYDCLSMRHYVSTPKKMLLILEAKTCSNSR